MARDLETATIRATLEGGSGMARAEASIQIDRPVEDVFAQAADLDRWPEWAEKSSSNCR